jgi:hypothetical protein
MINILFFSMLISSSAPIENNHFKENISGDWHSFISGSWKVTQEGNVTNFFKNEKDESGNEIGYLFSGTMKEGNFIDEFSFVGTVEDSLFQMEDGDFCLLSRTLKTKGRIDGEVIHMSGCVIKVTINCLSGKYSREIFNCSGTWR